MADIIIKRLQIATQINDNDVDDSVTLVNGRLLDDVSRTVQTASGEETNHISIENTIKPKANIISDKVILDFLKPRVSSKSYVGRSERRSENPYLTSTNQVWFSVSVYIPDTVADDPIREINLQWHAGISGSSPIIALGTENGHFQFKIQFDFTSASEGYQRFHLGYATRNVWHHFIVRYVFSSDIALGRCTVWWNGIIARLYNPITQTPWVIPTASGGGIANEYIAYPVKGSIVRHLDADNLPVDRPNAVVSVLDWEGRTSYADSSQKHVKWGFYKSQWGDYYDSNGVPKNLDDPDAPFYIPPANRLKTIYISNMLFCVGQEKDYEKYPVLDINGSDPLEFPDWFEKRPIDPTPPLSNLIPPAPHARAFKVKIKTEPVL